MPDFIARDCGILSAQNKKIYNTYGTIALCVHISCYTLYDFDTAFKYSRQ